MGLDILRAISQHDPVNRCAIGLGSGLARLPDQFSVKAEFPYLVGFRVNLPDQVEIDEAVINGRYQCIGPGCDTARKFVIAARCVKKQLANAVTHARYLLFQSGERVIFKHFEIGLRNVYVPPLHGGRAIFEIAI